jgi:HAMP domain-containing protein
VKLPFNTLEVIAVGQVTAGISGTLDTFRYVLAFAIISVVVLAGLGGLFLASRVLRPVEQITKAAQEIEEKDLSRRIDVKNDDELGWLRR